MTSDALIFEPLPKPAAASSAQIINALSVDVEDYFQVQALENQYRREDWDGCQSRVETNTDNVLKLFDEAGVKGTFFTLGWVAERNKPLIRRIVDSGHELACHGYAHIRVDRQSPEEFREDLKRSKTILEDIGGQRVIGYRAATFSIGKTTPWAFDIMSQEGFEYSSSINPVHHDLYGMPDAPRFPFKPTAKSPIAELPMSTLSFFGRNIPCAGGGYFRLLPYWVSRFAVNRVNRHDRWPLIFYFHPWEIDPGQPRPDGLSFKSRFRHYTNLNTMESRLARLLRDFSWDRIDRTFGFGAPSNATPGQ